MGKKKILRRYAGRLPGQVGRAARQAGIVPDGKPRTFLGEFPSEPERVEPDPEWEAEVRTVVDELPGDLRQKAKDVRFLALIAPGPDQMSITAAWRKLHPTVSMKSAAEAGSRRYREIRKAIGDRGVLALWGVHVGSIAKTIADAQQAQFVRQFIARDGSVVEARPLVDHNVRLQAATLAMKLLGKGRDSEERTQPVIVNVVSYLSPDAKPFPGGGRVGLDGVLRPTCGPDSYQALAARGAIHPALPPAALPAPDGALGEPKNQP